ncbi:unnamed protein product [marine sediment metagenome]|uniref:Uncharacterized protein n=1 Tax=marine sediment metagenome TaxID=412755 RepID=X0WB54_9ZZZZ
MKPRILIILLILMVVALGCSQVQMSAPYRAELNHTANRLTQLNKRCQYGDSIACKEGLRVATDYVNLMRDAVDGKESE